MPQFEIVERRPSGLVGVAKKETVLGYEFNAIALGTTTYAAGEVQNQETGFFPSITENYAEEIDLLKNAHGVGFGIIDSATIYGDSEVVVGVAFSDTPRSDFLVITKVGIRPTEKEGDIVAAAERSAERIGFTPHNLMFHNRWKDPEQMYRAIKELDQAKDRGLAESISVSNLSAEELAHVIDITHNPLLFYEAKINLHNPRGDANDTLLICNRNGITFLASAALNRGATKEPAVLITDYLSKKYGKTPSQIELFAVRAAGTIPIVLTKNVNHMVENMQALDVEMEQEDINKLMSLIFRLDE